MENFYCKQESHLCSGSSRCSLRSSAQVASAIASFLTLCRPKIYTVSLHLCQDRTLLSFCILEGKNTIKHLLKDTLEKNNSFLKENMEEVHKFKLIQVTCAQSFKSIRTWQISSYLMLQCNYFCSDIRIYTITLSFLSVQQYPSCLQKKNYFFPPITLSHPCRQYWTKTNSPVYNKTNVQSKYENVLYSHYFTASFKICPPKAKLNFETSYSDIFSSSHI